MCLSLSATPDFDLHVICALRIRLGQADPRARHARPQTHRYLRGREALVPHSIHLRLNHLQHLNLIVALVSNERPLLLLK